MCLYGGSEHTGLIPVLGTAPGMVGCVQATEVIKILTGLGNPLLGRLLLIDGLAMRMDEIEVARHAGCPHCGGGSERAAPPAGVRENGSPDA
jgi:adenylyltransferase/sulfurtransferase